MHDWSGVEDVAAEIGRALHLVPHDRWQLNGLRAGRLWVIADSGRAALEPATRCRRVMPLARRCLSERTTVTVTSVWPPEPRATVRDWELDWATLLYVPVSARRRRPCGVLIVGARNIETYSAADLEYISDLGEVVAHWVRAFLEARRPGEKRKAA